MKIVKKILTLLLIISLSILVMPNNKVLAEEDEPENDEIETNLGAVASSRTLTIVNGVNEDKTNNVITYSIEGTESSPTLKVTPEGATINNLTVSIDERLKGFVIEINGNVSLSGYYDDDEVISLISSTTNLAIVGNGTLDMKIVSNPNPILDDSSFEAADASVHNCYVAVNGRLVIGSNAGSRLTVNLDSNIDSNVDERPYSMFVDGLCAKQFIIENTTINSKLRNSLFYCIYDPNEEAEEDPLTPVFNKGAHVVLKQLMIMNNSKIVSRYKPLLDDDHEKDINQKYMLYHFFCCEKQHAEGDFMVNNSTIDIEFDDSKYQKSRSSDSYAIELKDASTLYLDNSSLKFNSDSHVALCCADRIEILDSTIDCKYYDTRTEQQKFTARSTDKPMMLVNGLYIEDSNFKFESSNPIANTFYVEDREEEEETEVVTAGRVGKESRSDRFIYIIENSKNYSGRMAIEDRSSYFLFDNSYSDAFTGEARAASYYDEILIATKANNLMTRGSTGDLVKNPRVYVAGEELYQDRSSKGLTPERSFKGMYLFRYTYPLEMQNESDSPEKIQWKELKIVAEHTPRHEVLNTGIN